MVSKKERAVLDRQMQVFYEGNKDYLKGLLDKDSSWFSRYAALVDKHTPRGARILECGVGVGSVIPLLQQREILGIDISQSFLREAKRRFPNNLFLKADGRNLPFKDGCFDALIHMDVIEHVPAKDRFLLETARVLKRGGVQIIQCPNLYCNLFSTMYKHSIQNMTVKFISCLVEWFRVFILRQSPRSIAITPNLKVVEEDKDAVNLLSPFDMIHSLRTMGFRIRYFTSFGRGTETMSPFMDLTFSIMERLPIFRYLGGRMHIVAVRAG